MPIANQAEFNLGEFTVRPLHGEIVGPDGPRHLQPKVMEVLLCLAEHRGEVVERQTLLDRAWGTHGTDEALTRCISELRQALHTSKGPTRHIRTIPKRGYRLAGNFSAIPPIECTHPQSSSPRKRPTESTTLLVGTGMIIIVAATIIFQKIETRNTHESLGTAYQVVVADFENATGSQLFDETLGAAFITSLEQSRWLIPISRAQIQEALTRMRQPQTQVLDRDLAIEIAMREGMDVVITGGLSQVGDRYRIEVKVFNPETRRALFVSYKDADSKHRVLSTLDELSADVRTFLGESKSEIERNSTRLELATTSNLLALKAFTLADAKLVSGHTDEAIALLEHAIDQDPEFALAHARLGRVLWSYGISQERASKHWNLALANSDRLTSYERLYVRATRAYLEEPKEMISSWRLLTNMYPNRSIGHYRLGRVYLDYLLDFENARRGFENAAAIGDHWQPVALHHLGIAQLGRGAVSDAIQNLEYALSATGDPDDSALADAYLVADRPDDAHKILLAALRSPNKGVRIEANLRLITFYIYTEDHEKALQIAKQTSALATRLNLEGAYLRARAAELALLQALGHEREFDALIIEMEKELLAYVAPYRHQSLFQPPLQLRFLATIAARRGDVALAERLISAARTAPPLEFPLWSAFDDVAESEIWLHGGQEERAIDKLENLLVSTGLFQAKLSLSRATENHRLSTTYSFDSEKPTKLLAQIMAEKIDRNYGREFSLLAWQAMYGIRSNDLPNLEADFAPRQNTIFVAHHR